MLIPCANIEEDLNARIGKRTADQITSIDIPVIEELVTGLYGFGAGIDQWISGTRQLFTKEQIPTTITQYANSEIADSLDGIGKYAGQGTVLQDRGRFSVLMDKDAEPSPVLGKVVGESYCFAEELANALGVTVTAPNKDLYIFPDGHLRVGKYGDGEFITYKPNQRRRLR